MDPLLFNKLDIYSVMENQKRSLREAISSAPETMASSPDDDVVRQFLQKFDVQIPSLDESRMEMNDEEVDVDVSSDPRRFIPDDLRPFYIKGTKVTVHVPFEGESVFFDVQPNTFTLSPPLIPRSAANSIGISTNGSGISWTFIGLFLVQK